MISLLIILLSPYLYYYHPLQLYYSPSSQRERDDNNKYGAVRGAIAEKLKCTLLPCVIIERPRTSNPRSCYMASFTTRERLIKLYTEHGYVSPTPKKFVPRRRTRKKKRPCHKESRIQQKDLVASYFGVSSTQTLTGKK